DWTIASDSGMSARPSCAWPLWPIALIRVSLALPTFPTARPSPPEVGRGTARSNFGNDCVFLADHRRQTAIRACSYSGKATPLEQQTLANQWCVVPCSMPWGINLSKAPGKGYYRRQMYYPMEAAGIYRLRIRVGDVASNELKIQVVEKEPQDPVKTFNGQPGEKGKADRDTEFWALRAIKKELAELEAKIAVKEKELADLRKKAGALQVKVVEAKLGKLVEAAIQEARILYPREPAEALEVLREGGFEVSDSRWGISEGARQALLHRLATAQEELIKKRK